MRPMPQLNTMSLKPRKSVLLGTSALVCLTLAAPVMADDFVITSSDNSTNGVGTKNGATAADIVDNEINGSDTVSLGIALRGFNLIVLAWCIARMASVLKAETLSLTRTTKYPLESCSNNGKQSLKYGSSKVLQ